MANGSMPEDNDEPPPLIEQENSSTSDEDYSEWDNNSHNGDDEDMYGDDEEEEDDDDEEPSSPVQRNKGGHPSSSSQHNGVNDFAGTASGTDEPPELATESSGSDESDDSTPRSSKKQKKPASTSAHASQRNSPKPPTQTHASADAPEVVKAKMKAKYQYQLSSQHVDSDDDLTLELVADDDEAFLECDAVGNGATTSNGSVDNVATARVMDNQSRPGLHTLQQEAVESVQDTPVPPVLDDSTPTPSASTAAAAMLALEDARRKAELAAEQAAKELLLAEEREQAQKEKERLAQLAKAERHRKKKEKKKVQAEKKQAKKKGKATTSTVPTTMPTVSKSRSVVSGDNQDVSDSDGSVTEPQAAAETHPEPVTDVNWEEPATIVKPSNPATVAAAQHGKQVQTRRVAQRAPSEAALQLHKAQKHRGQPSASDASTSSTTATAQPRRVVEVNQAPAHPRGENSGQSAPMAPSPNAVPLPGFASGSGFAQDVTPNSPAHLVVERLNEAIQANNVQHLNIVIQRASEWLAGTGAMLAAYAGFASEVRNKVKEAKNVVKSLSQGSLDAARAEPHGPSPYTSPRVDPHGPYGLQGMSSPYQAHEARVSHGRGGRGYQPAGARPTSNAGGSLANQFENMQPPSNPSRPYAPTAAGRGTTTSTRGGATHRGAPSGRASAAGRGYQPYAQPAVGGQQPQTHGAHHQRANQPGPPVSTARHQPVVPTQAAWQGAAASVAAATGYAQFAGPDWQDNRNFVVPEGFQAQAGALADNASQSGAMDRYDECESDDEKCCVVCMDGPKEVLFYPCRHIICCRNCSEACMEMNKECPYCRALVEKAYLMSA